MTDLQGKDPLLALGQGTDEAGAGDGILAQPLRIHALVDVQGCSPLAACTQLKHVKHDHL